MKEFEFIQKIKKKSSGFINSISSVRIGIGDDCAVLSKNAKTDLVITTDLLIEDIDFRLSWTKPKFLGHKALAVSLSDVAAMGAKPVWAMLSIGVPKAIWQTNFIDKFYDGWIALARKFDVELIGGDVSQSPDKIVIDSIVAGETKKGKAILRSSAKPNDFIFVSGTLGGAAAGLKLLEKGENDKNSKYKNLLLRQLKPQPQTEIGQLLSEKNLATAMIDLSDGLTGDLAHICRASKVGAMIYADKIPFDSQILDSKFENEKLNLALNGGEDFELLFTVNPKKKFQMEKQLRNYDISLIGEITANAGMIELITDGKSEIFEPKGFEHFG